MTLQRRACLALVAAAALPGCATGHGAMRERIVELAGGREIGRDELLTRVRASEVALLGELHDNPQHHAWRGELLAQLPAPLSLVAEQLPSGAAPRLDAALSGAALREALEGAGFDARGWGWPLHEPLFASVARSGHRLLGGNLQRDDARRLAREGGAALAASLRPWVDESPLAPAARAALEADLKEGHCGQLSDARLPGMVAAQRGRDAAMAEALVAALQGGARAPVLLLAGNGHVRRDYGVPQMLAARRPALRTLVVGLVEQGMPLASMRGLYDVAWIAPAAAREDPCKG